MAGTVVRALHPIAHRAWSARMTKPVAPDIDRLHAAYAAGLTPAAMVEDVYRRIREAGDPGIFLALVPEEEALKAARALPSFGGRVAMPLWGVPFAVKDNIDVAGLPTTAACPAFAYVPARSATAVDRLLAAGALLIGKTNLDQFATGLVGVRTPHPVPRNAFDPSLVPGGSSSGSAVAVARGLVSFALGTDTAGSGRVPAALNNIVGLKPSVGAVSTSGVVPACRTLDCVSVFALTVEDAHTVLAVMAGPDAADPFSRPLPAGRIGEVPPRLRLGVPAGESLVFGGDERSARAWAAARDDLAALGADLVEIDLDPFFEAARLLYDGAYVAERDAAVGAFVSAHAAEVVPVTRGIVEGARRFSATDAFKARYRLAELAARTAPVWQRIDALAVPSLPRPVTLAEIAVDPLGPNALLGTYTNFVNLLDLCALAVPARFRADGLPAGVTLIAPRGRDAALASIGRRLHGFAQVPLGATGERLVPPAPAPATAVDGEIELVVVGAHLSGLPLNHELTGLGGRFLRAVPTEPCYRLFALPGGPPRKPGLLRVASGEGSAIATEVWALSPDAFGRFVAAIPPPLGIGTLRLADGTTPKGFLAEAEALRGAEDVSSFGGWRAFMAARAAPR
jgi:allophanate hydrolase